MIPDDSPDVAPPPLKNRIADIVDRQIPHDLAATLLSLLNDAIDAENAYHAQYRDGRCRRCNALAHPERSVVAAFRRRTEPEPHRMRCPLYVGPLKHRPIRGDYRGILGYRTECSCGQTYPGEQCPASVLAWRGPTQG